MVCEIFLVGDPLGAGGFSKELGQVGRNDFAKVSEFFQAGELKGERFPRADFAADP